MSHDHWTPDLVSIIVPVLSLSRPRRWRHPLAPRRNLNDLLDDLEHHLTLQHELMVVCNSYQDRELLELVTTDTRINKFCLNSKNTGVARSWNMGAMLAEGEYLCFVNDDVEVGPGSLETLCEALASDPGIGQVGPRGAMWPDVRPGEFVGLERVEEADAIAGYLFMTRRAVFDRVGGFDVAFTPAGGEEIDFSFAVRDAGYRCLVIPGIDVTHHGLAGVSSRNTSIEYLSSQISTPELALRNREILRQKWREQQ